MGIEKVNTGQIVGTLTSKSNRVSGNVTIGGSASGLDYDKLKNKPMIEGVVLEGDKTFEELNMNVLTNAELEAILV